LELISNRRGYSETVNLTGLGALTIDA
jgi:hypothetical protein